MSKVFKTIDPKLVTFRSWNTYKTFRKYYDGLDSGSLSVLIGKKPTSTSTVSSSRNIDKHFSPTPLNNPSSEPKNSTGAYYRTIYHLTDKLYYKYAREPIYTFTTNETFSGSFQKFTNHFPETDDQQITLIGLPQKEIGYEMKPGSVRIETKSSSISGEYFSDDSYGNLYSETVSSSWSNAGSSSVEIMSASNVGNIFYRHGNIVVTTQGTYKNLALGTGSNGFHLTHKSTEPIYENEFICETDAQELNATMNSSIMISGSDNEDVIGQVTHSLFSPYVTTVGLYSDKYELLAVGKLARPVKKSHKHATSFVVRIDF
tara:strand:- start:1477 stop:2427 length:951 start_codon:yes stop_codon:yes gene_type:complete